MSMDADGDFVIAWSSGHTYNGPTQDGDDRGVYAQRYNAEGTPQGNEFQANTYTTDNQMDPSVGMDSDGDFVIAWTSGPFYYEVVMPGQDGSGYGIYAQRYKRVPEIAVTGQGQEIADGDTSPSPGDNTDFGQAIVGNETVSHTFTISNSGDAPLTLGTVTLNGPHAGDFSVTQQPTTPIPANGSASFTLQFAPSATGVRTAQVSLSNNDADETPYTFAIQGSGVTSAPEIVVKGLGQEIVTGDSSPSLDDGTDFGNVIVGSGTVTHTFTISNTGTADLTIGQVSLTDGQVGDFDVVQPPTSPIPSGGSSTFQISFTPFFLGPRINAVSLENNDANENPYTFTIQGTGVEDSSTDRSLYLPIVIKE